MSNQEEVETETQKEDRLKLEQETILKNAEFIYANTKEFKDLNTFIVGNLTHYK